MQCKMLLTYVMLSSTVATAAANQMAKWGNAVTPTRSRAWRIRRARRSCPHRHTWLSPSWEKHRRPMWVSEVRHLSGVGISADAYDWDESPLIIKLRCVSTVAPIPSSGSGSQITRSNSIPANDMGYELYGTSPLGSSLSLADRPKSMMRSGSFREPSEDGEPWIMLRNLP